MDREQQERKCFRTRCEQQFAKDAMRTFSPLTRNGLCEGCARILGQPDCESQAARKRATEERARNLWASYHSMFDGQHVSQMTGTEFERFVGKLYSRLGYSVSLTQAGADQGADLILSMDGRKIAVQAKRWAAPVGNAAVQQVIAGKLFYGCSDGMIVTTSTFSRSAVVLAAKDPTIKLINGRALNVLCQELRTIAIPEFSWEEWKKIEFVAQRFA